MQPMAAWVIQSTVIFSCNVLKPFDQTIGGLVKTSSLPKSSCEGRSKRHRPEACSK